MQKPTIYCNACNSASIVKRGFAKNKLQALQKYQCKDCNSIFTTHQAKGKTYPLKIILNAVSTYNLGYSLEKTAETINRRYSLTVSTKTIGNWLKEYKGICTYSKLRKEAIKQYNPKNIVIKKPLQHIQPYTFKYHKAKLYLLFHSKLYNNQFHNISHFYEPLKNYLEKISTTKFPHHIFTYNNNENTNNLATSVGDNKQISGQRASQIKFEHLKINVKSKNNLACKLAKLAINLASANKERHQAIQDFMLINDSTTIAVEVPVYLTNWDLGYYRNQKGFIFPLDEYTTPITGHIDILQIRNGIMRILDYKPEAHKIQPIEQLTLSNALGLMKTVTLSFSHCMPFMRNLQMRIW